MILLYISFLLFCILLPRNNKKLVNNILTVSCVVLSIGIAFRDMQWPDTDAYWLGFTQFTPEIFDYRFGMHPVIYDEQGFFMISVISKTFINNYHFFFFTVGVISMWLLFKNLNKYSIFPLLGLCAYLARFFIGRNLIQIRSGLAYLIILWGLKYVHEKKVWHYIILVWVASWFHHSAWIALPFYFFSQWGKINKVRVVFSIVGAFLVGAFLQDVLSSVVTDSAEDLNITTYTLEEYKSNVGLGNPMIYFQSFILLAYTFMENKLRPMTKYYDVIRDGYLYSTVILISFCSFTALSGRTSTMFATLEYSIIPSLVFMFNKRNRAVAYAIMVVGLGIIMYLNMPEWAHFTL